MEKPETKDWMFAVRKTESLEELKFVLQRWLEELESKTK